MWKKCGEEGFPAGLASPGVIFNSVTQLAANRTVSILGPPTSHKHATLPHLCEQLQAAKGVLLAGRQHHHDGRPQHAVEHAPSEVEKSNRGNRVTNACAMWTSHP